MQHHNYIDIIYRICTSHTVEYYVDSPVTSAVGLSGEIDQDWLVDVIHLPQRVGRVYVYIVYILLYQRESMYAYQRLAAHCRSAVPGILPGAV